MSNMQSTPAAFDEYDRVERNLLSAARQSPTSPGGWAQAAIYLSNRGEHLRAVQVLWEAIAACGNLPVLLQAIADLLANTPGHPERIEALARLVAAQPDNVDALVNLGFAALQAPNPTDALPPLRRAVELGASGVEVLLTLASAERQLGSITSALELYDRVLKLVPDHATAIVERWHSGLGVLDWSQAMALEPRVAAIFERETPKHVSPLMALALPPPRAEFMRDFVERGARSYLSGRGLRHVGAVSKDRLRVGYLSADFVDHATTVLTRSMFGAHDRTKFEVYIYSYGPRSVASGPAHIAASVEHWHDISTLDDDAAASLIRSHQLDVLVEMKGHTAGSRPEISRQRVAPVQVHYLGCPAPVGDFGIDYYVGDGITVPAGCEHEFNVPVYKLPRCYLVNDQGRAIPTASSRSSLGVPDDAVLLGNFNQLWKLRPEFMVIWCRVMRSNPKTLLWLLDAGERNNQAVAANLDNWLKQEGFADLSQRIIFMPRLRNEPHMNRLCAVDLCVDQLPYGSHTTAADALWAGVPVLTVRGNSFAGRVGVSVLTAHDETSFIADDLADYEARLTDLVASPSKLKAAKDRLIQKRATSPLFDTDGFMRDWEVMLTQLHSGASHVS